MDVPLSFAKCKCLRIQARMYVNLRIRNMYAKILRIRICTYMQMYKVVGKRQIFSMKLVIASCGFFCYILIALFPYIIYLKNWLDNNLQNSFYIYILIENIYFSSHKDYILPIKRLKKKSLADKFRNVKGTRICWHIFMKYRAHVRMYTYITSAWCNHQGPGYLWAIIQRQNRGRRESRGQSCEGIASPREPRE